MMEELGMRLASQASDRSSRVVGRREGMAGVSVDSKMKLCPVQPAAQTAVLDEELVRREFPILRREMTAGKRLVYLDSAATSLKPACVIETVSEHYRWHTANVHRGLHRLAEEATEAYEQARERIAHFINARAAHEVIFTRGTTESINLVAWSWGRHNVRSGDVILVSDMEHHSNLIPWQQLASAVGAELRFIPLTGDGNIDLVAFDSLIDSRVKLVAISSVSNVLGTINPIERIV